MTMAIDEIRKSICSEYDFEEIGIDELLVHTGIYYDDGDEFHIVLKSIDGGYVLSDEGHTLMWLSYEEYNFTPNRTRLLEGIVSQNNISLDDGRLNVFVDSLQKVGPALSSLVQAIMQTSHLRYLSRNNVASTFVDDIRSAFLGSDLRDRCDFKKKIPASNGNTIEPDVFIEDARPVLVFGAYNPERAKEVFINLLFAKGLDGGYRTVVIIDSESGISQKDMDRLINTANRPIMGSENIVAVTKEFISA